MLRDRFKKYSRKTTVSLAVTVVFFVVFFIVRNAGAQQAIPSDLGLNSLGNATALGRTNIFVIVGRIVQVFLGLLGMIFTILILYGGYLWMTSMGDPKKVAAAKSTIINAVVGLAIILSSMAIAQFVINLLQEATTGRSFGQDSGSYSQPLSGSLGVGIVAGHVPDRGATAPRNTKVAITFKEPINERTIIADTNGNGTFGDANDLADTRVFKMTKTSILKQNSGNWSRVPAADLVVPVGKFTPDRLNFVFSPTILLGTPTETVSYTVFIAAGLRKVDGTNAFSGGFSGGYQWEFQVEPKVDTTPPRLESIVPSQGVNPRNTLVQINFNEPIDPTSVAGITQSGGTGFQNIVLRAGINVLAGNYKITNGYRTVEFFTNDICGVNSCGGEIYCLPPASLINGLVKAATVGAEPPQAAGFPYDGVADMAGNSLDGNGNGTAEGQHSSYNYIGGNVSTGDNVAWSFSTSDLIDLVPPRVLRINPGIDSQNVPVNQPIEMYFSKVMSANSLNNSNLSITHNVPGAYELWYAADVIGLDANDNPTANGADPVRSKAVIRHGDFVPSVAGGAQYGFFPSANSKVQDLRQNCFNPSVGPSCAPTAAQPYCCNGVRSAAKCAYVP
jgi:hypothetical protein